MGDSAAGGLPALDWESVVGGLTKTLVRLAVAAAALFAAPAVQAASMINPDGTVTLSSAPGSSPFAFKVEYLGYGGNPAQDIAQLTSTIDFLFTGTSNGGAWFNFDFGITNDSAAASRLSVFGFDVDPTIAPGNAQGNGTFDVEVYGAGNMPNWGPVELCFKDAGQTNNCNNGQGGVTAGNTVGGSLILKYAAAPGNVTLSRFVVRYQSVNGIPLLGRDGSAIGVGQVVPEPASWAMMILGFGFVGSALRRRAGSKPAFA